MSWIVISDSSEILNNACSANSYKYVSYQRKINDEDIHDWIQSEIKDCDGVIIPLSLNLDARVPSYNIDGLLYAMHLRLNYEDEISSRLPIVLLSNLNFDNVLRFTTFDETNNLQYLLFTKGVEILPYETEFINQAVETLKPLTDNEYASCIQRLNIKKKSNVGNHDISNAWGCYRLASILGPDVIASIKKNTFINKHLKQLFSKYLICKNEQSLDRSETANSICLCQGKKILFIDDKSDEGWAFVMKNIFTLAKKFEYVDASKYKNQNGILYDAEKFLDECKTKIGERWDLIIMDLRLDPNKEDMESTFIDPNKFSGIQLMNLFLAKNKGYQIIISTASNKAWNIVNALNNGARGFYIKESPEFSDNTIMQYRTFIEQVNKCFEKSALYDLFLENEEIKKKLDKLDVFDEKNSVEIKRTLTTYCDLAFNQINKAKDKSDYNYAYLSLYNIIEELCKNICFSTDIGKGEKKLSRLFGKKFVLRYNSKIMKYENYVMTEKEITPSHYNVIDSIYEYLLKDNKQQRSLKIGSLIDIRNKFIHPNSKGHKENKDYKIINSIEGYKRLSAEIHSLLELLVEKVKEIKSWEQEQL